MAKKLLIITPVYPPYHGGIGYVAKQHADGMRALGYDVKVAHIHNTPTLVTWGNAGFLRLGRAVREADIIHLHYPFGGTAERFPLWKKRFPHKQFFITYHMDAEFSGLKARAAALYAKWYTPFILSAADRVFVTTREYAQAWSNGKWFSAHADRVIEAPLGVDLERFAPQECSDDWKIAQGIDPYKPTVLFVGGMDSAHAFKGVPVLLEAFEQVHADAQLVLVGDGDLRSQFEQQAQASQKDIHFVGSVSAEELPHWYNTADVVVLPSTTRGEAFGLVLVEAMASKTACIASSLPGVAQVLDHGGAGVLVLPGDADALARQLQKVIRDKDAREEYAQRGYDRATTHYTWKTMVDTYQLWYTRVN